MIVKATYTIKKKDGSTQTFSFETDKLPNEARNFFIKSLVMEFITKGIKVMECYGKVWNIWENEYGEKLSYNSIKDIATDNYTKANKEIKRKQVKQRKRKNLMRMLDKLNNENKAV